MHSPEHLGRGLLGIVFLLSLGYLLSNNRRMIRWKLIFFGLGLQIVIALAIIYVPAVSAFFDFIAQIFVKVINTGKAGARFLFGRLMDDQQSWGFIFAIQALTNIIFFAALSALLYYFGILQKIVLAFAWLLSKIGVSGPESVSAAANVFMGQTEAPLLVRPYLENMRKTELLCIMAGGMATTAGSVLGVYVNMLGGNVVAEQEKYAKLLLMASVMAAPASIIVSKMLVPDPDPSQISKELKVSKEKIGNNVLDAIANGTGDGLRLAVNVGAMLIAFIALIAVLNGLLGMIGRITTLNDLIAQATGGSYDKLSLQFILGYLFAPLAWMIGVPSNDMTLFGQLLGEKTILNEFIAYESLSRMKSAAVIANEKTLIMASFALCGFANFSSIGIQIGGIGALAPNQRQNLTSLGIKALIGGTIATLMTATLAGALMS
ncbi:MAG: NupC/NupG family nucleoside CNT transporter [Chitinophagaceae bacterium]|nr:NupC/NupG family nucleoside CNT transporter [Chitinophagaceae bacterium]